MVGASPPERVSKASIQGACLGRNLATPHLEPFIAGVYPDHHRFMQDNDLYHTSKRACEYYDSAGINWWRTPPESPDMKPIENVWQELKYFLQKTWKPHTKDELVEGIMTFWQTQMSRQKYNRYINLQKVIAKVIERGGRASGF